MNKRNIPIATSPLPGSRPVVTGPDRPLTVSGEVGTEPLNMAEGSNRRRASWGRTRTLSRHEAGPEDVCDKCGRGVSSTASGGGAGGSGGGGKGGGKGGSGSGGSPVAVEPKAETPRFWRTEYSPKEFQSVRRASEMVCLNLSGTSFVTTRDTLTRDPCTYFSAMLRMQPSAGASAEGSGSTGVDDGGDSSCGEFFIDRDPTHFRHILNYLRDNYIGLDSFGAQDLRFMEELLQEAQFFNVSGLCQDLTRRMSEIGRKHREEPSGDKDFRLVHCLTTQIQEVFHEWVIEKNFEFECMQVLGDNAFVVLGRRVSRGELALVERLMKT